MRRVRRVRRKRFYARLSPLLVGAVILGSVFLFFLAVRALALPKYLTAQRSQAKIDARTLLPVADKWRSDHPHEDCPTPERLRSEREISSSSKLTDPWDHPYVIECEAASVAVRSAGPDGKLHSPDDIVVPE
jgi:hypothetical protein